MKKNNNEINLKEQYIQTKNYKVFCKFYDQGFKNTIILVHGLGVSGKYMEPVAKYLAQSFNVYIPDLPGFGKSHKPKNVLNIEEHADFLNEFIEHLNIKKVIYLANSFGTQVVVEYALKYPLKSKALILIAPTVDPNQRTLIQQAKSLVIDLQYEPLWQRVRAIIDYHKAGTFRMLKTAKISVDDRIEKKLPKIKIPALVMRGTKDPFISKKWANKTIDLLSNGTLVEINGKGHTLNSNSPQQVTKEVIKFLKTNNVN